MMMINMITAALMVMLKTVMKRIAKTPITLITTLFIMKMEYPVLENASEMDTPF